MANSILDITQHLLDQIKLMNERLDARAGAILTRVIGKLGEKNAAPFSAVEEGKLCGMFKLEGQQLKDVLETCGYIFEQCAYWGSTGDALEKELVSAGLRGELASAFGSVWDQEGGGLRAQLSERSIVAKRLEDVDWSMSLQLGQQDRTRIKQTGVVLSLALRDQDKEAMRRKEGKEEQGGNELEHVLIEMSHQELTEFSKQLDLIQEHLDALG